LAAVATASGLNSRQLQLTFDTGNPDIGVEAQLNWGQTPIFSIGVGGRS